MRRRWTYTIPLLLIALLPRQARSGAPEESARDLSGVHVEPGRGPEFTVACRMRSDSVDVLVEGERVVLVIDSARGRGSAAITRKGSRWPDEIIVRFTLSGLESLKLSCGGVSIDDPPIQAYDSNGKPVDGRSGGGHLDVAVPRSLLAGAEDRTLVVTWADVVFRR